MSVLPASVRLALWASAAFSGRLPIAQAVALASPDVDHVTGAVEQLELWRGIGEQVVLVSLPRPGDLTGMPRASAELVAAATDAGECVYVPSLGGALVPSMATFGSDTDQGWAVSWTAYDGDPVPTHVLEALSLAEVELRFRQDLMAQTMELDRLDARPWAGDQVRARADERLNVRRWGLPEGLPPRAVSIITTASRVGAAAELGLQAPSPALTADTTQRRQMLLTRLQSTADTAVATAACVAALHLAGLRS